VFVYPFYEYIPNLDISQYMIPSSEWLKAAVRQYHSSKHATKAPHVQGVVIILQVNKQLRPLEVPMYN
jgi:hypothetical protein